jgi:hypothetical protein
MAKNDPRNQDQMITLDPPIFNAKVKPMEIDVRTFTVVKQKAKDINGEKPR